MEEEHNRAAKGQLVSLMQAGHSWQEAATMAGIQISRSAAYRHLAKSTYPRGSGLARWQAWTPCQTARTCASLGSKTTAKPLQAPRVISFSRPLPT